MRQMLPNICIWHILGMDTDYTLTRMHSSRMRTVRCSGHLSRHACPPAMHTLPAMHASFAMHTPFTTYVPPLPHMPPFTTHVPLLPHIPPFTTHVPLLPHMPSFDTHAPLHHTCPPFAMHAPPSPCTPPPPWTEFLTHTCENITFPQQLLRTVMTTYKECKCQ